jgi:hypothetical protein
LQRHGGVGRVGVTRQKIRAQRDRVGVAAPQQVARQRTHVADVNHRTKPDVLLDAEAEIHDRRRAGAIALDAEHILRSQQPRLGQKRGQRGEVDDRVVDDRCLLSIGVGNRLDHFTVVEYAEAAADRRLAFSERIVGKADAGRGVDPIPVHERVRIARVRRGRNHAVRGIARARSDGADQSGVEYFIRQRIDADPLSADRRRRDEPRLPGRIVLRGVEPR